jgi:CRISPR/Cas system-associated endonuclease/helicase Cas3
MKLKGTVLGDDAINFCLAQLRKRNVKPKGRKYTTEDKILALAFYKQSGRAYSKLREFFALPTRQTIMSMLNKVPINAGFNKLIFDNLKESASKLNSRDKMCALIFDEMAIMPHIDYDKSTDKFYGFQDFGDSQNFEIADHVLVFYLRGLFRKWQ